MFSRESASNATNFFRLNYPRSDAVSVFAARVGMALEDGKLFTFSSLIQLMGWSEESFCQRQEREFVDERRQPLLWPKFSHLCTIIAHPSNFAMACSWLSAITILSAAIRTANGC